MMKKKAKLLLYAILLSVITLAFTVAVHVIDVKPIGPAGTSVGFSRINGMIALAIGSDENGFTYSETLYRATELLGIVSFAWIGIFGLTGLIQWIRRKNMFKVDAEILALGIVYLITLGLYVLFEKVAINFRPVLMPGETVPEASFPSSHTVLTLVLWVGAAVILRRYIKNRAAGFAVAVGFSVIACAGVLARALSGAHWATDILAGILYGATMLYWLAYLLWLFKKKQVAAARKHAVAR